MRRGGSLCNPPCTPVAPIPHPEHVEKRLQAAASKKGAMRALGRVVRDDEAANEVVAAGGLSPVIALLSCNDAAVVRRCAMLSIPSGAFRIFAHKHQEKVSSQSV